MALSVLARALLAAALLLLAVACAEPSATTPSPSPSTPAAPVVTTAAVTPSATVGGAERLPGRAPPRRPAGRGTPRRGRAGQRGLPRYVWVDGERVNARLVEEGSAAASTYPPDVEYADLFTALQRQARESGRGMWSDCATPAPPAAAGGPGGHPGGGGRRGGLAKEQALTAKNVG